MFQGPDWKPHDIDSAHVYPHSLAIGDIDGDGDLDVLVAGQESRNVVWF